MRVKTEDRRLAILAAATEVFRARGYKAASMAEIAERTGGSKATLYSYFSSKDELFREVMKTQAEDRMMGAFGSLAPGADLAGTLQRFGEHYLDTILSRDLLIMRSIVMGEGPRSSMGRMFFDNGPAEGWGQLARFLEGQMQAGRLACRSPWRAALQLISLLEADYVEFFMTGLVDKPGPERIAESVAAALAVYLHGYGVDAAGMTSSSREPLS